VKIAGSQYLVSEGDEIEINNLPNEPGEKTEIEEVLLLVDNQKVIVGRPLVDKVKVSAKILRKYKGKKVRVTKFKAKTGYRRVRGFRPEKVLIKIEKITP
jgi:large subunit ribosomal protein L21